MYTKLDGLFYFFEKQLINIKGIKRTETEVKTEEIKITDQ